jgi:hypothetical protein
LILTGGTEKRASFSYAHTRFFRVGDQETRQFELRIEGHGAKRGAAYVSSRPLDDAKGFHGDLLLV